MAIEFKKKRIGEKKIMVRIDTDDYKQIKEISRRIKEPMGQIIRVIVKNYLKLNEVK